MKKTKNKVDAPKKTVKRLDTILTNKIPDYVGMVNKTFQVLSASCLIPMEMSKIAFALILQDQLLREHGNTNGPIGKTFTYWFDS